MKKGFTLAEVLITLAIIGVVAALTIPSIILNTNQSEYKTALKKAVSVLNQAVSLQSATDESSPSETTSRADFIGSIQRKMNTIKAANGEACEGVAVQDGVAIDSATCAFTTTDGMQFVLTTTGPATGVCEGTATAGDDDDDDDAPTCAGAGTQEACTAITGCSWQTNAAQCANGGARETNPCYLLVDVNGDKNPNRLTTDGSAPSDRFYIRFGGEDGTTISPAGPAADVMFK